MSEPFQDVERSDLTDADDAPNDRIRVLLADERQLLRQAMRAMIESRHDIEVVAEASDGHEAVALTDQFKPDIVLMDPGMPGLNGVAATNEIVRRNPRTRVLIVTGQIDDPRVPAALCAGAHGYLVKRSDINELRTAIQTVQSGNPYFSRSITHGRSAVEFLLQARREATVGDLSPREWEVVQLVAAGHTNRQIADRLAIHVNTVEAHKAHITTKLKAQSRTDLLTFANQHRIVGSDDTVVDRLGRSRE
jgi:DNA-binding NarL/FixJ family response regulator